VGNYWFSILLIAFTLNRLSYIHFVVLLSVLFLKSTKNGAVVYGIRCLKVDNTGRFLITFSRDEKVMIERLEENPSEQLRLRLAVELNGERKRRPQ
jgi:hypothetical protein